MLWRSELYSKALSQNDDAEMHQQVVNTTHSQEDGFLELSSSCTIAKILGSLHTEGPRERGSSREEEVTDKAETEDVTHIEALWMPKS